MSTYNLVVKFPTPQGVGILRGDQATTQSCYVTSLHKGVVSKALKVEEINSREMKDGISPVEELIEVVLDPKFPNRFISIGTLLGP